MEVAPVVVFVGALVFLAHAFAAIFSRTKIPDVLLLILIGLCLGPVLGLVTPAHFGAVGPVFSTVYFGFFLSFLLFVVRVPVVRLSIHKSTPISDASLMAVMIPKGLAAAVLASIPVQQGIVGGELIQDVTYAVVLFSIILTSLLVFLLDRTRLAKAYERLFSGFRASLEPAVGN